MLPFQITTFDDTLENFRRYYIQKKGYLSYEKLYRKTEQSSALAQIFGTTLNLRVRPAPINFSIAASNTFIFGSVEKITLAALIALKLWQERVNKIYDITPNSEIEGMFRQVMQDSRLTHI